MAFLIGEYECTLDVKQRIRVPAGLLSQLTGDDAGKFVIYIRKVNSTQKWTM